MKKLLIIICIFLFSFSPLMATDWEKAYNEEVAASDILQNDYDELLKSHKELQSKYDNLLDDNDILINNFENLNDEHKKEVEYHTLAKEQIELNMTEIKMLRDNLTTMISLADVKYFTTYFQGGMLMNDPSFDLGLSIRIPRAPFAVMAEGNYVVNKGFGFKIGAGIRF